jgi:hypothetical protein
MSASANQVLSAIRDMSLDELKLLCQALDKWPNPLSRAGYVAVPKSVMDVLRSASATHLEALKKVVNALSDLERRRKRRKSSPETVRRNVEICERRKKDRKTWSLRNLARKYNLRYQSVQKIVNSEAKWRKLASQLTPD